MANPVMKAMEEAHILEGEPMTISGAINKTFILLGVLVLAACYTWGLVSRGFMDMASMLMWGGTIVGFILALVICFTRKAMPVLTSIYAVCEGLFIGGISAIYAGQYAGIVVQTVILTFAVMLSMLLLYRARIIQCTDTFRSVIFTATLSVCAVYLIQIIASFFGRGIPQIFTASPIGIGFSVIVVLIAAFNFIVDFDFVERGEQLMLPKEYEWYGAFGLMVTLVWLYLEVLRLLAKINSRR